MIKDLQLQLANVTVVSGDHDTGDSPIVTPNAIDLLAAPPRQIGNGEVVKVRIQITTTFVGATATVNFELVESAAAALSTPTVLTETGLIAVADLVAGAAFTMMVPIQRLLLRYLGAQLNVATANITAGAYEIGIVIDEQTNDSDNAVAPRFLQ